MNVPNKGDSRGRGVVLVGFRGTGKTTVGRIVAERLQRPFWDADIECERLAGQSIAAIFASDGEAPFRDLEERVLAQLTLDHSGAVIATGGGCVLRSSNVERIKNFGHVIWLTAPPQVLADRLARDTIARPALTQLDPLEEIATLLSAREPFYQKAAHTIVATEGITPLEVANRVIGLVEGTNS